MTATEPVVHLQLHKHSIYVFKERGTAAEEGRQKMEWVDSLGAHKSLKWETEKPRREN